MDVFCHLPLRGLLLFQHLEEFLCPSCVKFYHSAVCENMRTPDESIRIVSMVNGNQVSMTDVELTHFMGWSDEELQEVSVDRTADDVYEEERFLVWRIFHMIKYILPLCKRATT